jgi:hypothetical protein
VVGASQSELYRKNINYNDERLKNSHWHYKIASFPISHGLSGGPVFILKNKVPHVLATITGLDYQCLGVLCATITHAHIDSIQQFPQ